LKSRRTIWWKLMGDFSFCLLVPFPLLVTESKRIADTSHQVLPKERGIFIDNPDNGRLIYTVSHVVSFERFLHRHAYATCVCVIIIPSRLGWLQKTINICWRLGNHQLVHPLPTTIRKSFRHVRDPQDIFGYLCPLPQVTCAWRLAGTTWPMLLALVISARDGKIWPPGWLGVGWAETSTSTSILGHLGPGMKLETMNHHDAVIFFRWLPRVCVLNHQELVEKAHGATEQKGFPLKVQWWVGQNGKTWGDGEGHPWIMIYTLQWY
jgi:hypothetical protein